MGWLTEYWRDNYCRCCCKCHYVQLSRKYTGFSTPRMTVPERKWMWWLIGTMYKYMYYTAFEHPLSTTIVINANPIPHAPLITHRRRYKLTCVLRKLHEFSPDCGDELPGLLARTCLTQWQTFPDSSFVLLKFSHDWSISSKLVFWALVDIHSLSQWNH